MYSRGSLIDIYMFRGKARIFYIAIEEFGMEMSATDGVMDAIEYILAEQARND